MDVDSTFVVKYLGYRTTSHLWGIKYTRAPVDEMVKLAKQQLTSEKQPLPLLRLQITNGGIEVSPMPQNQNPSCPTGKFPIKAISYGVQDIVYTRVFAMIVVNENEKLKEEGAPFRCHAFVCDSRETARKLTIGLAKAFEEYSKKMKGDVEPGSSGGGGRSDTTAAVKKKRPVIDLKGGGEDRPEELDFSEA